MRRVKLYGELSKLVGAEELELEVASPAEAVRALVKQVEGARYLIGSGEWRVVEGDRDLSRDELTIQRRSGPTIHIVPALAGAGSGQNAGVFKILAGVFLIGAAIALGPFGLGVLGGGLALLTAGIGVSTALGGISRILAPMPAQDPMIPEAAANRQSYLFTSGSNLQGDGHPIPLAYGQSRIGSVQISQTIVTVDDTVGGYVAGAALASRARGTVVDLLSEGEIDGLVTGDAASILFDNTRVEEVSGGVNFQNVEWDLVTGAAGDPATVSGVESLVAVNTEATNATGDSAGRLAGAVVRTIADPNVDFVRVTLRWPQLFAIVPPVTGSIAAAYGDVTLEVDADGGGFIPAGLTGAQTGNGTTGYNTVDDSGAALVTGLQFGISAAWEAVDDPGASVTFRFSYRVVGSSTWTEIVATRATDYDVVNDLFVTLPEGLDIDAFGQVSVIVRADDLPGAIREWKYTCDQGEPTAIIGYDSDLDVAWYGNVHSLYGITTSPYERDLVIPDLPAHGPAPWTIRVGKVQLDYADPTTAVNSVFWARYAEGIEREFVYEDLARIRVSFDAETTGGAVPQRSYEVRGLKIRIPDNLTPSTRTYSGVWSGTFATDREYYDNPAWILLDLLTHPRYGFGIPDSRVDLWSFYDAAKWCDELVPSPTGGTEPRCTFHHVFTTHETPERTFVLVASSFQALVWYGAGKVFVSVDKPISGPPARIFTNANVVGGGFEYQMVGRAAHITSAAVQWRNPDNGYAAETLIEDRPFSADRYGHRESAVVAVGTTSEGQARRRARFDLLSSELETCTAKWRAGANDAVAEPGEIAEIWDRDRMRVRRGGRIVNYVASDFIRLDFGLELDVPANYVMRIALDDGSIHESEPIHGGVTTPPDTLWILDTPVPVGREILDGAVWICSELTPIRFRMLGIEETGPNEYEIAGIAHDPGKQALIEDFDDRGAELIFPLPTALDPPTITSVSYEFDAPSDTWTVVVDFTHDDPDAAYWGVLLIYGLPPSGTYHRSTTSGLQFRVNVGDHDVVGGASGGFRVQSAPLDGATLSAWDDAFLAIPATRP